MLAELVLDFLPWPGRSGNRGAEAAARLSGRLHVPDTGRPGAIKQALNGNGWLAGGVLAAGELRQGKEPSLLAMLTGTALIEVLRPRRSKSLPRHFVLAVTRDRVVAFGTLALGDDVSNDVWELLVRPGALGSWPRESVRLVELDRRGASVAATLELDGLERVPVFTPNDDPSTGELLELLAG